MIALDSQPFSIVEDRGFTRLVRELEPRCSLPSRKYDGEDFTIVRLRLQSISSLPVYVS